MSGRNGGESIRYGEWPSPVTAESAVGGARQIAEIEIDNGAVWLAELRPGEGGRTQIVRLRPDGVAQDVLPADFSARSRVHEYGGGAILADRGAIYFVNDRDQRIWRDEPGGKPQALTPEGPWRYADMIVDPTRGRLIAVREDHSGAGEPVNALVAVDLASGAVELLWQGSDFVAWPRLSPGGTRLAWIAWNHPNMPWDATTLHLAAVAPGGALTNVYTIAAARDGFSVIEPVWSEDGALYFLSDAPGDWALHRWNGGEAELVCHADGEIGGPAWQFRASHYALLSNTRAVAALTRHGADTLISIDLVTGTARPIETPFTDIRAIHADGREAVIVAASPESAPAIYRVSPEGGAPVLAYRPDGPALPDGLASKPYPLAFPTGGGVTAFAFYYPPLNAGQAAPEGETPPLIVTAHGGPTGLSKPVLSAWRSYWTSRGFAVLDVNYRGSTGYGRAYRKALNGTWGEADIDDVVAAARYSAAEGLADPQRMAVYGGSAGGYIVLAALAFHPGVFRAGINLFGISDLEALAADTHKFEARYCDTLIGPLPQTRDLYRARSPIHAADRIDAPLLTLQGLDDKVVPPAQSEAIFAAVRAKGAPAAYLPFEGEGHGFRKSENQLRTLTATHDFLARVFDLHPRDNLEPVKIENLP